MEPDHQNDRATSRKRRRPLPPPPTEPPPALVRLLQDDAAVREYFSALQAHLDADIRKWKERAMALKQENQSLKLSTSHREHRPAPSSSSKLLVNTELEQTKPKSKRKSNGSAAKQKPVRKVNPKRADSSHSSPLNDEDEAGKKRIPPLFKEDGAPVVPLDVGVPIEDSMFDVIDSDDDDDDEKELVKTKPGPSSTTRTDALVDASMPAPIVEVSDIFLCLKEAYDIFQQLGIALVTDSSSSHPKESVDVVDMEAADASPPDHAFHFEAVGTEHVMEDILRKIATNQLMVVTSSSVTANTTDPDATSDTDHDATPSDYFAHVIDETGMPKDNHPFREGKRLLLRALVLMDTFCGPFIPQTEWDRLFVPSPTLEVAQRELECMNIGLRSRKQLIDRLIFFLNDAITERWVSEDRARRLLNTRVHFEEKEEAETETVNIVGMKRSLCSGNLVERSTLGQLATCLLLLRNDRTRAVRNILQYAAAATPQVDDVPKLPPLLSLVALENFLLISDPSVQQLLPIESTCYAESEEASSWFHGHVLLLYPQEEERDRFYGALGLVIHLSAAIWEQRLASTRDTIHDVAAIELFSYKRLLSIKNKWLNKTELNNMNGNADILDRYSDEARNNCLTLFENNHWMDNPVMDGLVSDQELRCLPLEISLILDEDNLAPLNQVVGDVLGSNSIMLFTNGQISRFSDFLMVLANTIRQLDLRRCDSSVFQHEKGSVANLLFKVGDCSEVWQRIQRLSTSSGTVHGLQLLLVALKCFGTLADGWSVLSVLRVLLKYLGNRSNDQFAWRDVPDPLKISVVDHVRQLSACPIVRVINLSRRKDRMQSFLQLALRERLLVLKAVVDLKVDLPEVDGFEFGCHAVDGSGRLVEATERLVQYAGSLDQLNNLVKSHWRPNDLKPFDVDAPTSETLVRISPSERACALSHILSWRGVLRSLRLSSLDIPGCNGISSLLRSPSHIIRLFKITGFAKGPALLPQNNRMPPTAVCVILEDDAVLLERFRERLDAVLLELPRDFHFCSLGYGRPKAAPIVPFSEHIGIPSMLWYLTGYCLSEAGAQYLLDALPVVGPVDSWIGLKMTNNWDNVYGTKLGVGSHGKPKPSDLPSRDDLCRTLQFHAYCAVQPLCSQKVRLSTTAATRGVVVAPTRHGRHWRQRDTDIEYSGGDVSKMTLEM